MENVDEKLLKEQDSNYSCQTCEAVDDYDFILKCIIVGNSGVGKTSLLHRMTNQSFMVQQSPTIGIDFGTVYNKIVSSTSENSELLLNLTNPISNVTQNNENGMMGANDITLKMKEKDVARIKVQVWDCAGQVRFRSIVQGYFRQAKLVFFVYDRNNYESFRELSDWVRTVNEHIGRENYVGCIIGNKSDLQSNTELILIERFCAANEHIKYYTLSAKTDSYETVLKPLQDCVLGAYNRYKAGKMEIEIPYWKSNVVNLNGNGKANDKKQNACLPTSCTII